MGIVAMRRNEIPMSMDPTYDYESRIESMVSDAIGRAAGEVVVQVASGGGASNSSDVVVKIDELHIHVHDDAE